MQRKLTNIEFRKLQVFEDLMDEIYYEKNWFIKLFMNMNYKKELAIKSIEVFLAYDIKEMKEVIKEIRK